MHDFAGKNMVPPSFNSGAVADPSVTFISHEQTSPVFPSKSNQYISPTDSGKTDTILTELFTFTSVKQDEIAAKFVHPEPLNRPISNPLPRTQSVTLISRVSSLEPATKGIHCALSVVGVQKVPGRVPLGTVFRPLSPFKLQNKQASRQLLVGDSPGLHSLICPPAKKEKWMQKMVITILSIDIQISNS